MEVSYVPSGLCDCLRHRCSSWVFFCGQHDSKWPRTVCLGWWVILYFYLREWARPLHSSDTNLKIVLNGSLVLGYGMVRCNIFERCWFYRRQISPMSPESEMLQKYCNGRYIDCARYQFAQYFGFRYLPRGLQPSEIGQVKGVLRSLIGWAFLVSYPHSLIAKIHTYSHNGFWVATILLFLLVAPPRLTFFLLPAGWDIVVPP